METFTKAETLVDNIKEYINNRITTVKLQAAEKISKILASIIAVLIVSAIMLMFILFISIAIALLLSEYIGNTYSGFFIVGGLLLLKAIIIWRYREMFLQLPIMNKLIQQMFADEKDT